MAEDFDRSIVGYVMAKMEEDEKQPRHGAAQTQLFFVLLQWAATDLCFVCRAHYLFGGSSNAS